MNRNGILATKTVWHEILLRHMIFTYHFLDTKDLKKTWKGQKKFWRPNPKSKVQNPKFQNFITFSADRRLSWSATTLDTPPLMALQFYTFHGKQLKGSSNRLCWILFWGVLNAQGWLCTLDELQYDYIFYIVWTKIWLLIFIDIC